MTDLDQLIAAEREHPPAASPDEVKANWKRISASAAVGVPLPVDLSPAAVKVTASSKLAALVASTSAKVTVAVTLVGGSAVAVVSSQPEEVRTPAPVAASADADRQASKSKPSVDASVSAPESESVPVPVPVPEAAPAEAPEQAPATVEPKPKRPRPAPTTRPEEQDVAGELALIQAAQRSLRASDPQSALANLRTHQQRYPKGTMSEDRLALRVLALCAAGRHDEGARAQDNFLRSWPKSIYFDRVRQACDHESPESD